MGQTNVFDLLVRGALPSIDAIKDAIGGKTFLLLGHDASRWYGRAQPWALLHGTGTGSSRLGTVAIENAFVNEGIGLAEEIPNDGRDAPLEAIWNATKGFMSRELVP